MINIYNFENLYIFIKKNNYMKNKKENPVLMVISIESELKRDYQILCLKKGQKMSEQIRTFIQSELDKNK